MIKKQLFFFILLASGIFSVRAQADHSLRLRVVEQKTQEPVVAAVISFGVDTLWQKARHAVTDNNGYATLNLAGGGAYFYRITSLGFAPAIGQLAPGKKTLTVFMREESTGLNELVVTGSRAPRPIKLSPVVTQVISGGNLVDAGYGNIQQALMQETPGMNIQKVGFGNEISMQGLDARHILFLMDGERMTGEMAGNLDYERFNLHAIDRVEIVKGASSTLYGSRAAGAVINIITKKTTQPASVAAGARYGQMNERNYTHPHPKDFLYMFEKNSDRPNVQSWLSAGFKKGKVTTQTDVWYSSSDAYYLYQKEGDRKVYTAAANPFLKEDVEIKSALLRPPMGIEGGEHISASQKIYYEPVKNFTAQLYGTAFFMNTYDLVHDLYFSQAKDFTGGLKLSYKMKDYFTLTGTLHTDFYERYKRHERIDTRQKVYDSRIIQPRLTLQSKYFKKHDLILGIDYFQDDLTSDRFVNQKMTTRALKELEVFFQDGYAITPQWMLEAGVRTNFSKQFGIMALPKLAVKYSPDDKLSYRFNYAMGYRSPSIKELFFNWDHLGMFQIIGDEKLQPEKNQYFSLGVEYAAPRFFLSTNAFGNFFYDKIEGVWRIYDFQYNFEYKNLARQRLLGIDALMRWQIFDPLTLNASYSFVNVSKDAGVQVNSTSPHAATGSLEYKLQKKNYNLSVNFTVSMMGKKTFDVQDRLVVKEEYTKPYGTTATRPVSHDAYFRCELPPYALCNLNITQQFHKHWKLSAGMNNVFNYVPSTLGSGITMFNIPATAGRRFFVQVEVGF